MGFAYAHTLNQYESARIQSWFPCLADTTINLDKNLLKRLEKSYLGADLSFADVTCALRWFNSVPRGFLTEDDHRLAERLSKCLDGILN